MVVDHLNPVYGSQPFVRMDGASHNVPAWLHPACLYTVDAELFGFHNVRRGATPFNAARMLTHTITGSA